MLSWGMSWFALVSIRQWLWYGTLVVKVLMICFCYGCSHGGFVEIGIDWNHGFVAIKPELLAVVDCLYPAMGLDIATWCLKVLFFYGMVTVLVVSIVLLLNKIVHELLDSFIGIHSMAECFHYILPSVLLILPSPCQTMLTQFNVVMGHVVVCIGINLPMALLWHLGS
jgi:hypothetical protein